MLEKIAMDKKFMDKFYIDHRGPIPENCTKHQQ
jgi:hypothetical protein